MDIERLNDYTVKFFISYRDIEDRGFDKEEIWYDRERGEELFWEVMDEASDHTEFALDGPLWIQVQAFDKGLEIIVTKAQLSKDGSKLELPISDEKHVDVTESHLLEKMPDQQALLEGETADSSENDEAGIQTEKGFLIALSDFEHVIRLSHQLDSSAFRSDLYVMDDRYYLYVTFSEDESDYEKENTLSRLLEFGVDTKVTIHLLEEYGKLLMSQSALGQVKEYFS